MARKPRAIKITDLNTGTQVKVAAIPGSATRRKNMVCIVFEDVALKEEGGEGDHFNVYVTGLRPELVDLPQAKWTPAEYWGAHAFQMVIEMVRATGAINKITKKGETQ